MESFEGEPLVEVDPTIDRIPVLTSLNTLLEAVLIFLSNLSMALMLFVVGAAVFFRYVLNDSPMWTDTSIASILFALLVFFGAPAVMRKRGHIVARFYVDTLSPRRQLEVELLCDLIILGFGAILAYSAWLYVILESGTRMPGLRLEVSYIYAFLILSAVAMMLFATENLLKGLFALRRGV